MRTADIVVGCIILFICVSIFILTNQFVGVTYTGYGPDRFPRFLAVLWGILGITLIVNAVRGKFFKEEMKITRYGLGRIFVVLAVTAATIYSMNYIGFLYATILYIFVVMTYLKEKSLLGRVCASVGIALSVYLLFRYVMVIPLPEFTLFGSA